MSQLVPPETESPIRVLIVDDQAMVRASLNFFLLAFDDLESVGDADCVEGLFVLMEKAHPDVVLMDLVLPGIDAIDVIRDVRGRWPEIQVIALTSFWTEDLVHDVLAAGACGYLLKDVSAEKLADAIRAAHGGCSEPEPQNHRANSS
jgi:NarL family two-component system response regulator LiaR